MNRLLLITMIALLLISACSVNTGVPEPTQATETYTGLVTKVAILPLMTMDARSRNIRKILEVRDLEYVFSGYPQYELMDLEMVANEFKVYGIPDVNDIEPEEMQEIASDLDANVLILGNISSQRNDLFAIDMKLYSARTSELRQLNFSVPNTKEERWEILNKEMMEKLDEFISTEVDKIFNYATNFYAAGRYDDAEENFKTVIGLDQENQNAHYYLGATYYKKGQYELAEQSFNKALELDPTHYQTLLMMNDMYEKTGENLKRIAVMEKIAAINEDAELWLAIGNLYAQEKEIQKAQSAFESALEIDENNALVQTRLAFLLYEQQKYEEALPYLERAYDRFPENDLISRRLAISYQRSGRMEQAIARYEGLIANNPNNTQAYLNVVSLYRNQAAEAPDSETKNAIYGKAITTMNQLISVDSENPMAYLNLASIYLAKGDYEQAEVNANITTQKDPSLYQPYVILATVSQSKGTTAYNRFVDLEKRAAEAVGRQATALSKDRDAAKASANVHFRNAVQYLTTARSLTVEPETLADINNRLSVLNNLVTQTTTY